MMRQGKLSWVDLSTFDVAEAQRFYRALFGWDFVEDGENSYSAALVAGVATAGLFEMPGRFQEMGMPSFWMGYIAVEDLDAVIAEAKENGGRVELELEDERGKFALIRDPAGAGFTCSQGLEVVPPDRKGVHGSWVRSELFVSDLSAVEPFYRELFGWRFEAEEGAMDRHVIRSRDGEVVGALQVANKALKGDKEFWIPFFRVDDSADSLERLQAQGGREIYRYTTPEGTHYLVEDSQGAAFFLTAQPPAGESPRESRAGSAKRGSSTWQWRAGTGLVLVYLAVLLEWDWLWGLLFLMWVIPDLKYGVTHFIEPVSRRLNPLLYWAIVLTWIGLSLFLLVAAIVPS